MNLSYVKVDTLIDVMNYYKFHIFDGTTPSGFKSHDLNIVNIRNDNPNAGKFDDLQVIFWSDGHGGWDIKHFDVTTDPGVHYLLNPMNKKGTAIVAPGQYRGVWKLGLHRGKYEALVQAQPIIVVRDNNKDNVLNTVNLSFMNTYKIHEHMKVTGNGWIRGKYIFDRGYFGINCHRASTNFRERIGLYSAGCCVHRDYGRYKYFIDIIKAGVTNWGNSFTSTWITETDYFNALHAIDND